MNNDGDNIHFILNAIAFLLPIVLLILFVKSRRSKGRAKDFVSMFEYFWYVFFGASIGLLVTGMLAVTMPGVFDLLRTFPSWLSLSLIYAPMLFGTAIGFLIARVFPHSFKLTVSPSTEVSLKKLDDVFTHDTPQLQKYRLFRALIFLTLGTVLLVVDFLYGLDHVYQGELLRFLYIIAILSSLVAIVAYYRARRK